MNEEKENKDKDREYHNLKVKEFRKKHKEQGLCNSCNEKAVEGKRQCAKHLEYHRFYKKFRWKKGEGDKDGNGQE